MKYATLLAAVLMTATTAFAQAPRVVNAAVQERAATAPFDSFFEALVRQQTKPAWIGYSVPVVAGHRAGCFGHGDWYQGGGPYYLEGRPRTGGTDDRQVKLEGDAALSILFRVENQEVGRIVVFSPDCELDAGGLPFFSLTGVAPADSVRLLAAHARTARARDRVARAAVSALALHADPAADAALEQLVGAGQPIDIRTQAAFWLGNARGERGYDLLRTVVQHDQSVEFRRQATSALAQSRVPAAIDTLIQMAKSDADPSVRGQALFWVAQKAGKKAASAITDAIANDPEAQVKERAVFALSRLPKDEGVPLLITVARSNRDPRVRERAMFWLGQSKDPRAVAFFEEVLKGR
jgi:HEAT repeats